MFQVSRVAKPAFAAVVLGVLSTLVACTNAAGPDPVGRQSFAPPRPEGASDLPAVTVSAIPPAAGTCNPRASLRPPATLPAPGRMPEGSTMRAITNRGRLIVGTDQNINLFSYRDPVSGRVVGFDVDVAREVVKALFGSDSDEFIQIVVLASDERFPAIRDKRVDLIADATTINCDRMQLASFSTVYYDAGQRILTSRASDIKTVRDLDGRRVCSANGTTSISTIVEKAPKAKVIAAKYWTDCLVMLQQNQADAITTDDIILYGLAAQDPSVHVVGDQFNPEPYGLVMDRSATDFVRFVNGVLDRMRSDGTWSAIYRKWLPEPTPAPPVAQYVD